MCLGHFRMLILLPECFSCKGPYSCVCRIEGGLCRISGNRRHISLEESLADGKTSHCNVSPDLVTPFYHRLLLTTIWPDIFLKLNECWNKGNELSFYAFNHRLQNTSCSCITKYPLQQERLFSIVLAGVCLKLPVTVYVTLTWCQNRLRSLSVCCCLYYIQLTHSLDAEQGSLKCSYFNI